jgi:small subunit ribosomal protein S6
MREYETTFIIQPEISDEAVQALCARLDEIMQKHGSVRLFYDDQGRRRMAYEIKKFQKGRYVTAYYLDKGAAVAELERTLRLDDSILRFLTVQADDEVLDIEKRKTEAAEMEKIRAQRAAERAAREAEEAAARAASGEDLGRERDADDDDDRDRDRDDRGRGRGRDRDDDSDDESGED